MKDIPHDRIWVGVTRDYVELLFNLIKQQESTVNSQKQGDTTHEDAENGKSQGNEVDEV